MTKKGEDELKVTIQWTAELGLRLKDSVDHVCMSARLGEMTESLFQFVPPDGLHIMGYLGQTMVSHALVTTRWLQAAELPLLKTAYVDAVSTLPEYQGRGFGSAVMRHLTTVIPEYEIGALQTERVSFYARVGWELWKGPLAGRIADGEIVPTPHMGADQIMIYRLPKTPELDPSTRLSIEYDGRMW